MTLTERTFAARLLAIAKQLDGADQFNLPGTDGSQVFNPEAVNLYWRYVSKRLDPEQIEQALDLTMDEDKFPRPRAFVELVLGSSKKLIDTANVEWLQIVKAIDQPGYRPQLSVAGLTALTAIGGLFALQEVDVLKRSALVWDFRHFFQAAVKAEPGCHDVRPERVPRLPGADGNSPYLALPMGEEVFDPEVNAEGIKAIANLINDMAAKNSLAKRLPALTTSDDKATEDWTFFDGKRRAWEAFQGLSSFAEQRDRLMREIVSMTEGEWIHPLVVAEIESWLERVSPAPVIDEAIAASLAAEMALMEA